ncbi:hypothetical protein EDD78_101269 [Harryflintia acetispora]|uniref:Uncharacterized protein n=1 Tax=Harryflintia acetispora TaxID=1849041 RepID=A0A9X8ULG0_9FIRM|nr:hypothetical protein EDD78_101269 [Harryflintia acetispora]
MWADTFLPFIRHFIDNTVFEHANIEFDLFCHIFSYNNHKIILLLIK